MQHINKHDLNKDKVITSRKSVEQKLEEAEKNFKEGKVYTEDHVWKKLGKKYGFNI